MKYTVEINLPDSLGDLSEDNVEEYIWFSLFRALKNTPDRDDLYVEVRGDRKRAK